MEEKEWPDYVEIDNSSQNVKDIDIQIEDASVG